MNHPLHNKQVLVEQGLGKFCDQDFIRYTSREMQEALNLTSEEMDMAAHQIMQQNPDLKHPSNIQSAAALAAPNHTNERQSQNPSQWNNRNC